MYVGAPHTEGTTRGASGAPTQPTTATVMGKKKRGGRGGARGAPEAVPQLSARDRETVDFIQQAMRAQVWGGCCRSGHGGRARTHTHGARAACARLEGQDAACTQCHRHRLLCVLQ